MFFVFHEGPKWLWSKGHLSDMIFSLWGKNKFFARWLYNRNKKPEISNHKKSSDSRIRTLRKTSKLAKTLEDPAWLLQEKFGFEMLNLYEIDIKVFVIRRLGIWRIFWLEFKKIWGFLVIFVWASFAYLANLETDYGQKWTNPRADMIRLYTLRGLGYYATSF